MRLFLPWLWEPEASSRTFPKALALLHGGNPSKILNFKIDGTNKAEGQIILGCQNEYPSETLSFQFVPFREVVVITALITGILLSVVTKLFSEAWEDIPSGKRRVVRARIFYSFHIAILNLAPSLVLSFYSTAVLAGIRSGIHNLPNDWPIQYSDGIMFVLCASLYFMILFTFLLPPKKNLVEYTDLIDFRFIFQL